jgi:hypothetical protein
MTDGELDGSFDDEIDPEEFLTLGRRRRIRPRRRSEARVPRRFLLLLAPTGWLAAAVLCLIAPYRAVVTLHRSGGPGRPSQTVTTVDGWGDSPGAAAVWPSSDFGILLWAGAALLLVLAGLVAAVAWGKSVGRLDERWLEVSAAGATALVVGVVAAVLTSTVGLKSWLDDRIADTPAGADIDASWGGCAWLALVAVLCAATATGAFFHDRARGRREPQVGSADEVFVID